MSVGLADYFNAINEIDSEKPTYRLGGYGADGTCDCVGMIIGGIRRCGMTYSGTHGSNWFARNEVSNLHYVVSASFLEPGDIVFKAREPGDAKYDLPSRYSGSSDKRDYYHIGIVKSVNPLDIQHMTSPTVTHDKKLGKWTYSAKMPKYVNYEGGDTPMPETAKVISENGGSVKLRSIPSTSTKLYWNIPYGNIAVVHEKQSVWSNISVDDESGTNRTGWMKNEFLLYDDTDVNPDAVGDTVTVKRQDLEDIYDQIGNMLGLRG